MRIGNWVSVRCVSTAPMVDDNWGQQEFNVFNMKSLSFNNPDFEFKPIPLTEEWHNKFGVVKNGFNNFEYALPRKNNMGIKIIFNGEYVMLRQGFGGVKDDIVVIWNKDVSKRDMYVHEWQNLYYTLASKELTLKN